MKCLCKKNNTKICEVLLHCHQSSVWKITKSMCTYLKVGQLPGFLHFANCTMYTQKYVSQKALC